MTGARGRRRPIAAGLLLAALAGPIAGCGGAGEEADLVVAVAGGVDRAEAEAMLPDGAGRVRWLAIDPETPVEALGRFRPRPDLAIYPAIGDRAVDPRHAPAWASREADYRSALLGLAAAGRVDRLPRATGDPAVVVAAADRTLASLRADLIGAVGVDAHEELRSAWRAIQGSGAASEWLEELAEPPPWPPGSVARLKAGPDGADLLDRLGDELAGEGEARDWLDRAWGEAGRVDDRRLESIAGAAGGRLAGSPPFRCWLRAEWTAWARGHFAAVARRASR